MVNNKIELLSPAGSFEALKAAVCAGCDAVYVGMNEFSARAYAKNFDENSIKDAIKYVHVFGVKIYVAVNIQLYDRELERAIKLIVSLWNEGVDGFIISSIGLASYLYNNYPEIEIHASTQATGQNVLSSEFFENLGFTRMVAPREISFDDLKILTKESNIEIELFIHGALCVCHSGQCLMSSIIGGRSGNRGECAQPCRMKYNGANEYPLSLKDLNLSAHMTEILSLNIASLKIEGRMKSPLYVYTVTGIYRKLIDENRNATKEEQEILDNIFSRSGSTDGYFTGDINSNMLGYRTGNDKKTTKEYSNISIEDKKIELNIICNLFENKPSEISGYFYLDGKKVASEYTGDIVSKAINCPLDENDIKKQITKLGGTPFVCKDNSCIVNCDSNIMIPISALNNLRRNLVASLIEKCNIKRNLELKDYLSYNKNQQTKMSNKKIATFMLSDTITQEAVNFFDYIFVDIFEYEKALKIVGFDKLGIIYPPVTFDTELTKYSAIIEKIKNKGCKKALITNTSQISNAFENGFDIYIGHRINVYNSLDVDYYTNLDINNIVFSPEIGLENAKKLINDKLNIYVIAYGRIPLMTNEKCVIRDVMGFKQSRDSCNYCNNGKFVDLKDSTKMIFKLFGYGKKYQHRNILFNSVPIWMADKYNKIVEADLNGIFYFTDESKKEVDDVIIGYKSNMEYKGKFRRI